jgi:hypothetical protein
MIMSGRPYMVSSSPDINIVGMRVTPYVMNGTAFAMLVRKEPL